MGESGSGKSASLRNFEPDEIGVFNVAGKPLPFRKPLSKIDGASYGKIINALKRAALKAYAIDDSQYLLSFELFGRAKEKGYDKFTEMAVNFYNLIQCVIRETPPDVIVYFLHHTELAPDGKMKAKTIGKMLDEKLTVEGLFSIVLYCAAGEDGHKFITQSQGFSTAKSPMDMFPEEIDNDLKFVDEQIREYYGLNAPKEENENAEA